MSWNVFEVSVFREVSRMFCVKISRKIEKCFEGGLREELKKNYETYNRSARVLFYNKCLSSNIKQVSNKFK